MSIFVDTEALAIVQTLQTAGFEVYIVGGAVRDMLLSTHNVESSITDFDFTTNAKPEEILTLFPESFYENSFGTVSITKENIRKKLGKFTQTQENNVPTHSNQSNQLINLSEASSIHESLKEATKNLKNSQSTKELYEITTYRSDGAYTNHRHPESITWGTSLEEDLDRRDFTINALALLLDPHFCNKTLENSTLSDVVEVPKTAYTVIDTHTGITDLTNKLIRTVGNPNKRFTEDALRILRAIRFSVQLNMQIENETYESISTHAHLLQHISWERIRDEFLKMLSSDYPREAIEILDTTDCLKYVLPELLEGKGVKQGGHHTTDVWEHSLSALAHCPSQDPIVRFATLIHDIGKPSTYKSIAGQPTFYNHEVIGARIAKKIAHRFKLSRAQTERIFLLVRYHMFYYQPENTDASIRRFMRKVGLDNINDILDLREADRLGSGARKTSWRLEEMKERMKAQLHQPFAIKDLAINGHDLMQELNIEAGPQLGLVLQHLFEEVLENPELNSREILLQKAQEIL